MIRYILILLESDSHRVCVVYFIKKVDLAGRGEVIRLLSRVVLGSSTSNLHDGPASVVKLALAHLAFRSTDKAQLCAHL